MASALVLPSWRKQEHLQAGRRVLDEFRKKSAAKKAAPRSQPHVADVRSYEKQPLETERVRHTDSDGAVSSNGAGGATVDTSDVPNKAVVYDDNSEQSSSNDAHAGPPSTNKNDAFSADAVQSLQTHAKDQEFKRHGPLGFADPSNHNYNKQKKEMNDDFGISSQSGYSGREEAQLRKSNPSKVSTVSNPGTTAVMFTNVFPENPGRAQSQNKSDSAVMLPNGHISPSCEGVRHTTKLKESVPEVGHSRHDNMQLKDHVIYDSGGSNHSGFGGHLHNAQSGPSLMSESLSTNFSFDVRSSSNHERLYPATAETKTRGSRPSFLDSLNMSRASSAALFSLTEPKKDELFMSNSSKIYSTSGLGLSASQKPLSETKMEPPFSELGTPSMTSAFESINSSFFSSTEGDLSTQSVDENSFEGNHKYHSPKHDEDFSALEQHIDDSTQEKFSLKRAVEASQALAESLAAENSSLAESYNQQGSIVNQLKSDMERLQEEIKAQLVVERVLGWIIKLFPGGPSKRRTRKLL